MKKLNGKKIWAGLGWGTMIFVLLFLLGFTEKKQSELKCAGVQIQILPEGEERFITQNKVAKIVGGDSSIEAFKGKPANLFNTGVIEDRLEVNPFVKNAEVFKDIDGAIKVEVFQREPIIRVLKQYSSGFYIDDDGLKMPLSPDFSSRILIATGAISESYDAKDSLQTQTTKDLYVLAKFISQNEFWTKQIAQVYVTEGGEMILYPTVGDHKILIGKAENLDEKFRKLWLFYKKALNKVGWDKYRVINLKYTGQIVCEK